MSYFSQYDDPPGEPRSLFPKRSLKEEIEAPLDREEERLRKQADYILKREEEEMEKGWG